MSANSSSTVLTRKRYNLIIVAIQLEVVLVASSSKLFGLSLTTLLYIPNRTRCISLVKILLKINHKDQRLLRSSSSFIVDFE